MNKEKELIDKLIDLAFAEDIGDGDHTTLSCIPATAMGKSKLLIKEAGVLAGIEVAKEIFNRFDPSMKVEVFINDGTEVKPGDVAMIVEGKVQSLLQKNPGYHSLYKRLLNNLFTNTYHYNNQNKKRILAKALKFFLIFYISMSCFASSKSVINSLAYPPTKAA